MFLTNAVLNTGVTDRGNPPWQPLGQSDWVHSTIGTPMPWSPLHVDATQALQDLSFTASLQKDVPPLFYTEQTKTEGRLQAHFI